MVKKVWVATKNSRGFLKNLYDYSFENLEFQYQKKNVYEKFKKNKKILYALYRKIDWLGYFQVIKVQQWQQDVNFSYNRFLKSNEPYVIYLENPSALVNYSWRLIKKSKMTRRIKKCLFDKNLKAIICMSQACEDTLKLYYQIPEKIKVKTIYPLVLEDKNWSIELVRNKVNKETIKCLFVSQLFRNKGGEDAVEVISKLVKEGYPIQVTFITKIEEITEQYMSKIKACKGMDIVEFGLSKEQLNHYYKETDILLMPTRQDSFGLVVLEAMKYGCALVASDLYAIKEMVLEGKNGYTLKPYYRIWNDDNTVPNLKVLKKNIKINKSGFLDKSLEHRMYEILKHLCNDRELLETLCENSYLAATTGKFAEKYIVEEWENLLGEIN